MNVRRLNHILIPRTKTERDRFRRSRAGRILRRLFAWLFLLSDEGRGALLLWLLSVMVSLSLELNQFYFLSIPLMGLLGTSLIIAPRFRLRNTHLEVIAPRRILVDETVTFSLCLSNSGAETYQALRLRSPFLPWDGEWVEAPQPVQELVAGQTVQVNAKARFCARGAHHLDPFWANQLVPLGLANGPALASAGVRFLVIPRIAQVAGLQMNLQERYQPGGVALASRTGESSELVGVRPYQAGDPVRDLHASTWARVGMPHVRQYQQEYFTRVGVVVDTDRTQAGEAQFEAVLSLAAGVLAHLSRGEALIDLLVLGDQVHPLVLGRHLGFLDQALDHLACVAPGTPLDAHALQARIHPYLERLSAMVYITLAWDETRQHFAHWVRSHGLGLRVIWVAPKKDPGSLPSDGTVSKLTISDINSGRPLRL